MIELAISTCHDDYVAMAKKYKLTNDIRPTGNLYRKYFGEPATIDKACNCGTALCMDRREGCTRGCCACNMRDGDVLKCSACDEPCGVLRALVEVLE